jgi:hypothetical protein
MLKTFGRFLSRRRAPLVIGPEFDYLAKDRPDNCPELRGTVPIKKAAVLASVRNEGIIILEWVAHYRAIGFDSIIVYTNDNDDESDALLDALHWAGEIELVRNVIPAELPPQYKAYRHAFWFTPKLWEHEWVAILDADEFLIPVINGRQVGICEYTDHLDSNYDCSAIALNWRWFPGDGALLRSDGLLFDRFKTSHWDKHVKTLFRARDIADIGVHSPKLLPEKRSISGYGEPRIKADHPHEDPKGGPLGQVNHYWGRSFQEFYMKRERGSGSLDRALRPWSAFRWGANGVEPDNYPDEDHIRRTRRELQRLLGCRQIRHASERVERHFRQRVQCQQVRDLYDATMSGAVG